MKTITIDKLRKYITESIDENGFIIEDGVVTGYRGKGGDIEIPMGVTAIGEGVFFDHDLITSVKIPDTVKVIGDRAFYGCRGIEYVIIPNSVEIIGESAFGHCYELIMINIPDSVKSIKKDAFLRCKNLSRVNMPPRLSKHMVRNPSYAFDGTRWAEKLKHKVNEDAKVTLTVGQIKRLIKECGNGQ